jgi:kinesin family protein 11
MAGPQRPASGLPTRRTGTRQATRRPTSAATERRTSSAIPAKASAPNPSRLKSPSDTASISAIRNQRDYEREINEDTSIHVVVRCRGRNDREIKENSGVVVSTEGAKTVELSMGPNAVSNKAYTFDKVFSAAADQVTVYEDVVLPIVNEVSAI